jgi:hypothetical protein
VHPDSRAVAERAGARDVVAPDVGGDPVRAGNTVPDSHALGDERDADADTDTDTDDTCGAARGDARHRR